jgi:urease accessory protein
LGWIILSSLEKMKLNLLYLLQLADTAVPIGGAAHSFGLETLAAEGSLTVPQLAAFFEDYLEEVGQPEGVYCRAAYRLRVVEAEAEFESRWLALNARLSALKLARESRAASAMLGKRLLQLVCSLEARPRLEGALRAALTANVDIHHAAAFGLAGGILEIEEELVVAAYLQQNLAGLVSACQRLLPLGQQQAARLLWQLKPAILAAAAQGRDGDPEGPAAYACPGLVELAGMRHPALATRLFIS